MMMIKVFISVVLVMGLLSLPGPSMPAPAKKDCCGASHSKPGCPDCDGQKSDCCQPPSTIAPLTLELSESIGLFHPPMPRIFPRTTEAYPSRAEAPLVPPPKAA